MPDTATSSNSNDNESIPSQLGRVAMEQIAKAEASAAEATLKVRKADLAGLGLDPASHPYAFDLRAGKKREAAR